MPGRTTVDKDLFGNEIGEPNGLELIDKAIALFQPTHIFALFSGGHDSLCATHLASQHPEFSGAVHINTGIGVPQTREFVKQTCDDQGWKLIEYKATDQGQRYEDMVLEFGFPGPFHHRKMFNRLKERCLRQLIRDHKEKHRDKIMLISGCRSQESERRMGTTEAIQEDGVRIWCAVIHDWSKENCNQYIKENGLRQNPVVLKINKSGECLCGAFARSGELDQLKEHFPKVAERIQGIESRVRAAGFPWGWEDGPPAWWKDRHNQKLLWDEMKNPPPLCWSCPKSTM